MREQIAVALAIAMAVGGTVYAIRSGEPSGTTYLLDKHSIIAPSAVAGGNTGDINVRHSMVDKKGTEISSAGKAWQRFTDQRGPGWSVRWNPVTGTPHLVTGRALGLPRADKLTKKNIESSSRDFVAANAELLKIEPNRLRLANAVRAGGRWYVSFQQIHNGLPVLGGQVNLSYTKDDRVIMFGSDVYPDVIVDTKPRVGRKVALRLAKDDCKATSEKARIDDIQLCILPVRRPNGFDYLLCWRLRIFQPTIHKKWEYLIDAVNGRIVSKRNILVYEISGTVKGEYKPEFASDLTQKEVPFPYEQVTARGSEVVIASWNFDGDPGWSTQGQWAFGVPTGGGGTAHGNPDPTSGYTGSNVYGVNLNGDYNLTIGGPWYLTMGPIDCSAHANVWLKFWRWLNTDFQPYAFATIEVSTDGSSWTTVWENSTEITESMWSQFCCDISRVADNQPGVFIRWGYEIGYSAWAYSGWNIDDVELVSVHGGINTVQTQADGTYSVLPPWVLCDITSELKGLYCDINYGCGEDALFEQSDVGPDDVVDFIWNSDWYNEIVESSVYWHVNYVHDFYLGLDPSLSDSSTHYPLGLDYPMPVSVQIDCEDGYCNAYWDGEGMAFGAGDGLVCDDFGLYAEVIYHEYTHGVTSKIYDDVYFPYVFEPGALNEAWSDYFGCVLSPSQNPLVGDGGLILDELNGIRTLDNTYRRETDFSNSVHLDSQMLSGALWEARQAIGGVMDELVHFARYAHATNFEDYLLAVLVEDDTRYGDWNLTNGTPHGEAIYTAFGNHGIGGLQYMAPSVVIDDSSGNANGKLEPGETVNLSLSLVNGWAHATNVSATLSTTDAFVTINKNRADFSDVYHGGITDNATDPFVISLAQSCPETHTINFTLEITADGPYSYLRACLCSYAVAVNQLAYDDGQFDAYLGVSGGDFGMAVHITPDTYPCYPTHVRFFPYDGFKIYTKIWDDDGPRGLPGTVLGEIEAVISPIDDWADVDISYLGIRIDNGGFYVGCPQSNTIYDNGLDMDPPYYGRSWIYFPDYEQWSPLLDMGWLANLMVRARWSNEPPLLIETPYEYVWTVGKTVSDCISAENGTTPYNNWIAQLRYGYTYSILSSSLFNPSGTEQGWNADDGSWSYDLAFSFPYYGSEYSTVNICSNGFLDFAGFSNDYYNSTAKLINNIRIAPLWDDLRTDISLEDDIYIDDSVPSRLMIRWQGRTYASGSLVSFAVVLFEGGSVRFDYDGGNTFLSPTVGISAGNGTDYVLVSEYNGSASLTNVNSVLFSPVPGESPLPPGITIDPNTGCFSGTPMSDGYYQAMIQVGDSSQPPKTTQHHFDFYVSEADLQFAGFEIIEKTRIGRCIFRYVLSLSLTNTTDSDMTDVYVDLINTSQQVTAVIDDKIFFPSIDANGTADSNSFSDYFIIEVDRSKLITDGSITCQVVYTKAGGSHTQLVSTTLMELLGVLAGDVNLDGEIDIKDVSDLTKQWLWSGVSGGIPEDVVKDGSVNFLDFASLLKNWQAF